MNKRNLYTFLFLCASMIAVIAFSELRKIKTSAGIIQDETQTESEFHIEIQTEQVTEAKSETETETQTDIQTETEAETEAQVNSLDIESETKISMENTLFIGDSRTVGLMEYAKIEGADFFCTVGMNIFDIYDEKVDMPGIGKIRLSELLENKKYDRIYIMLGINELGYPFDQIVRKYNKLVDFVKEKQPETIIFMQANLHVTKPRSDKDKIYNNSNINNLNEVIKGFADGKRIYYLDANTVFDDSEGALRRDMSSDNAHLYARYYVTWGRWIEEQTAKLLNGGE
ncbi:MAG: GDSL-type esterase/lipase family protein [Eubacteriales bacterium]|nr:GDSL-type esterase/lipase family protein [Eubacteriales bacterium]